MFNPPQEQYLFSQGFNSKKLEFVWRFPRKVDDTLKDQFVFQIRKDGSAYIEAGTVNVYGDYLEGSHWVELFPIANKIHDTLLWSNPQYNFVSYNYFTNGQDLIPLIKDVVEYLRSI